jgi:acyl dehydratase
MAHSTAFMPSVGESLPAISIPITLQRLVMEAGANRDFSLMHHDGAVAKTAGASDAFANTFFLMGMFERLVREWAGAKARFRKMGPLKMLNFNVVGDTLVFTGRVASVEATEQGQLSVLELWCESERGQTTTCVVELLTL